jgi:hypothetical protein
VWEGGANGGWKPWRLYINKWLIAILTGMGYILQICHYKCTASLMLSSHPFTFSHVMTQHTTMFLDFSDTKIIGQINFFVLQNTQSVVFCYGHTKMYWDNIPSSFCYFIIIAQQTMTEPKNWRPILEPDKTCRVTCCIFLQTAKVLC